MDNYYYISFSFSVITTWLQSSKPRSRGGSNNTRFRKGCFWFVAVFNRPKKRHTRDKVKQSTCRLKAPPYRLDIIDTPL